jgi:hypothetical protein
MIDMQNDGLAEPFSDPAKSALITEMGTDPFPKCHSGGATILTKDFGIAEAALFPCGPGTVHPANLREGDTVYLRPLVKLLVVTASSAEAELF